MIRSPLRVIVTIDLRPNSATFLHWHAERLSSQNHRAMLIPEGFAHGFQSLTDDVDMVYCHSAAYSQETEGGLNPHDAKLSIDWPLEVSDISQRDQSHPLMDENFSGIVL